MEEKSLYSELLKLDSNWEVERVEIEESNFKILVHLRFISPKGLCPFMKTESTIYDLAPVRQWRHLDTMQYQTWLVARVPRVMNAEGKVSTVSVPWADYSDRYTYLFSHSVIGLLRLSRNQTKTAHHLKTTFDVVNSIMTKSVERGLLLRDKNTRIDSIGIDEKSFKQGHKYCTIITDATNKRILEIVEDRTKAAAKLALELSLSESQKSNLKVVTGDMWEAYQNTVQTELPNATYVLDRFHLIKYLNVAIDKTRRAEVIDNPELKKTRFAMLKNPENLSANQRKQFHLISAGNYLVSYVWRAKEDFKALFGQPNFANAAISLNHWFYSLESSTIKPLKAVKEMFERHRKGVANALCHDDSNAYAERMNGSIQELKTIAKGFRNVANFRIAILFHYGDLNLTSH